MLFYTCTTHRIELHTSLKVWACKQAFTVREVLYTIKNILTQNQIKNNNFNYTLIISK